MLLLLVPCVVLSNLRAIVHTFKYMNKISTPNKYNINMLYNIESIFQYYSLNVASGRNVIFLLLWFVMSNINIYKNYIFYFLLCIFMF